MSSSSPGRQAPGSRAGLNGQTRCTCPLAGTARPVALGPDPPATSANLPRTPASKLCGCSARNVLVDYDIPSPSLISISRML